MKPPIAFAVFVSVALASAAAGAACPPVQPKTHVKPHTPADNCVDLNAVPQISDHIVAAEPFAPVAKTPAYAAPAAAQYEGPTLGMSKPDPGVRPAPTIGYHWSLE